MPLSEYGAHTESTRTQGMPIALFRHVLDPQTQDFYRRIMQALTEREVPFLVCGAYALRHHTGIARQTKDLDLFVKREDIERALQVLEKSGFRTELAFSHWLAKVYDDNSEEFIDIIFSSGNGVATVDDDFFDHAPHGTCFDTPIRWCPVEEMVWSKAFVMERERFDGADVAHLLHACSASLDWQRLLERFGEHWRVLFAHVVLFGFIYPNERDLIPVWVVEELSERLRREATTREEVGPVCGGTLISRQQFLVDICDHGYLDARVTTGAMTETEVQDWTAAIAQKE
jgi:hypothetical protein